jgi:hypothetical protein
VRCSFVGVIDSGMELHGIRRNLGAPIIFPVHRNIGGQVENTRKSRHVIGSRTGS